MRQADQDIKSGDVGVALLKYQWELYKYQDLTPDQLIAFKTFVEASLSGVAVSNISRALALLAEDALSNNASKVKNEFIRLGINWNDLKARIEFFESHPAWMVPILRHTGAQAKNHFSEIVSAAAAANPTLLTTTKTTGLCSSRLQWSIS